MMPVWDGEDDNGSLVSYLDEIDAELPLSESDLTENGGIES